MEADSKSASIYHAPPIDAEAEFTIDELFFSRTDERGVIQSANDVFRAVSQYEWQHILKKPHNVIRHPDMPQAVFKLLWDNIKANKPIGSYVKNKAKDGRYYWVYAIVTPVDNGYLSVRIKPSTKLLQKVADLYATLRKQELHEGVKPEQSLQHLHEAIEQHGYTDYSEFMAQALCAEMQSRHKELFGRSDPLLSTFERLLEHAQYSCELAQRIHTAYFTGQYVPLNLQIQAAQLDESGKTIDVIAHQYSVLSQEIKGNIENFLANAQHVYAMVNQAVFLLCTAQTQQEVYEMFSKQEENEGADKDTEMALLYQQQQSYHKQAMLQLRSMSQQADAFKNDCQDMKRLSAGLEVARMMGKMESARLSQHDNALNELIHDLDEFQQTTASGLREMDKMNLAVSNCIERIRTAS